MADALVSLRLSLEAPRRRGVPSATAWRTALTELTERERIDGQGSRLLPQAPQRDAIYLPRRAAIAATRPACRRAYLPAADGS